VPAPLHAAALAAVAAAPLASTAAARDLTEQERAGKRLYFEGASASGGELRAFVGAGTPVPASAVACASCHGEDGLGRPEGGVVPPAITWSELTKRYGHVHGAGRRHPAFDRKSVVRAVTEGVDPAGNPLDPVMPRFSLSREDAANLVAYLEALDHDRDPGLSTTSLRVAAVLPTSGRLADAGAAMRKVLEASFEELNAGGGIHGRRIELAVAGYDGDAGGAVAALRRLVAEDPPFALVSGLAPGEGDALALLAEKEKLPLVAPFGDAPPSASAGRYAFYALAGVRDLARVLARHAAGEPDARRSRTAVLHADDPAMEEAARAAAAELASAGVAMVERVGFEPGRLDRALVGRLARHRVDRVLFLGGDADLAAFLSRADALRFAPRLFAPGSLAARAAVEAPASFEGRILLAYPAAPSTARPDATGALDELRRRASIPDRYRPAVAAASTAASLLAEGLRRAGRAVSRERLVDSLEGLFRFDPGLAPPLTFGPARRVGALGGYVVAVAVARRSFMPVSGFIALD
jgi:ABC-type branched-subunit amino acid transport system substrate-binding protein